MTITGHMLTLTWQDYSGGVPAHARMDAYTATSYDVHTDYSMMTRGRHQSDFRLTTVSIQVRLDRARMWSRASAQSAQLLKHEQGHYDITALVMRDLDSDLTALLQAGRSFATQQDLTQAINNLQQPAASLVNRLQSTAIADGVYDQQTRHSGDTAAQGKWDAALASARASPATKLVDCLRNQGIVVR